MSTTKIDRRLPWKAEPATLLLEQAQTMRISGRFERATNQFALAAQIANSESDMATEASATRHLAELRCRAGFPDEAGRLARRSRDCASATRDYELVGEALNTMGNISIEVGQLDHAIASYEAALKLDDLSSPLVAKLEQNLGIVASIQGRWADAEQHFVDALLIFKSLEQHEGAAITLHNLGLVALEIGHPTAALQHFDDAVELVPKLQDSRFIGLLRVNRAKVLLMLNEVDRANAEATAAYGLLMQSESLADLAHGCRILGEIQTVMGRMNEAESFLQAAIGLAERSRTPLAFAEARRELGELLLATGRSGEAKLILEQALAGFIELHADTQAEDLGIRIAQLTLEHRIAA